jgi:hypothetical protein
MDALPLIIYALGAPIGAGCLLFVLWRLEDGLLGPPPGFPGPDRDGLNPTTVADPVSVTEPPYGERSM